MSFISSFLISSLKYADLPKTLADRFFLLPEKGQGGDRINVLYGEFLCVLIGRQREHYRLEHFHVADLLVDESFGKVEIFNCKMSDLMHN